MEEQELRNELLRHEYKNELFLVLESKLAKVYGGYVSIRKDLEFVHDTIKYLREIENSDKRLIKEISGKLHIKEYDEFLRCLIQSLYFASVITYGKCYSKADGRRVKLEATDILKDCGKELKNIHEKIIASRNQYIAHGGISANELTIVKLLFPIDGNKVKHPKIAYSGISALSERKQDMGLFSELIDSVLKIVRTKTQELAEKLMDEVARQDIKDIYLNAIKEQQKYLAVKSTE